MCRIHRRKYGSRHGTGARPGSDRHLGRMRHHRRKSGSLLGIRWRLSRSNRSFHSDPLANLRRGTLPSHARSERLHHGRRLRPRRLFGRGRLPRNRRHCRGCLVRQRRMSFGHRMRVEQTSKRTGPDCAVRACLRGVRNRAVHQLRRAQRLPLQFRLLPSRASSGAHLRGDHGGHPIVRRTDDAGYHGLRVSDSTGVRHHLRSMRSPEPRVPRRRYLQRCGPGPMRPRCGGRMNDPRQPGMPARDCLHRRRPRSMSTRLSRPVNDRGSAPPVHGHSPRRASPSPSSRLLRDGDDPVTEPARGVVVVERGGP